MMDTQHAGHELLFYIAFIVLAFLFWGLFPDGVRELFGGR